MPRASAPRVARPARVSFGMITSVQKAPTPLIFEFTAGGRGARPVTWRINQKLSLRTPRTPWGWHRVVRDHSPIQCLSLERAAALRQAGGRDDTCYVKKTKKHDVRKVDTKI